MRFALSLLLAASTLASAALACSADAERSESTTAPDASLPNKALDDDAAVRLPPVSGPSRLSETGLYSDFAKRTVSDGLIAYAPRHSFWADGAEKSRWLYLPPGTTIDTSKMDHWVFPVGTKVWKEFRVGEKLVETRLMMKVREDAPAGWWMAAYVWNEDGSDAVSAPKGVENALGTGHLVPTHAECHNCHQGMRDVLISVSAIQLSHTGEGYTYDGGAADAASDAGSSDASDASAGPSRASVLRSLADAGLLSHPPPTDFEIPGAGAIKDALAYLHVNCGSCHNDESLRLNTQTRMRLRLLVDQTTPEQTGAYTTTIGTVMRHPLPGSTDVLVPGRVEESGIWVRMARRDNFAMPPAGTQRVDDAGVEMIRRWIAALK